MLVCWVHIGCLEYEGTLYLWLLKYKMPGWNGNCFISACSAFHLSFLYTQPGFLMCNLLLGDHRVTCIMLRTACQFIGSYFHSVAPFSDIGEESGRIEWGGRGERLRNRKDDSSSVEETALFKRRINCIWVLLSRMMMCTAFLVMNEQAVFPLKSSCNHYSNTLILSMVCL